MKIDVLRGCIASGKKLNQGDKGIEISDRDSRLLIGMKKVVEHSEEAKPKEKKKNVRNK